MKFSGSVSVRSSRSNLSAVQNQSIPIPAFRVSVCPVLGVTVSRAAIAHSSAGSPADRSPGLPDWSWF